jgi:hypothetical protein
MAATDRVMFRICGCLLDVLFWRENRSFAPLRPAFFALNHGISARFDPKTTPYPRCLNIRLKFLLFLFR